MKSFCKCGLTQVCVYAWVLHLVTSAHSHVCRLLLPPPSSPFFPLNMSVTALAFLHPLSPKHLMSSAQSWNRRLWNMKRGYIRRNQSAAESWALLSICVQANMLLHPHKYTFKHYKEYAVSQWSTPFSGTATTSLFPRNVVNKRLIIKISYFPKLSATA